MKITLKLFVIALVMITFSACEKDLIEPIMEETAQIEDATWRGKGATGATGPQGAPGPQYISVAHTAIPFPKHFTAIIQEDEIELTEIPAQYRDGETEVIRQLVHIRVDGRVHELFEVGLSPEGLVHYCVVNSVVVKQGGFDPNYFVDMEPRSFRAQFEFEGTTSVRHTTKTLKATLINRWPKG